MVQTAPGDQLRLNHEKILEEEQTQLDHVEDVLPRCHRIMEIEIVHANIDRDIFSNEPDVRQILDAIMTEAREALMLQRQHRRTNGIENRGAQGDVIRLTQ